jgi:Zn-dependent peptidase ImmA (M78 family)/transcriptional regulator with XRE-family HTH domain
MISSSQHLEFVGARLELARAFQQITLKRLADTVCVSFGLLSHYENDRRKQPAPDIVNALARALKVMPEFFFQSLPDVWREEECSFRRRVATPEAIKKRARAHGTMIGLVILELARHVKLPVYNVPSIKASSSDDIERAAEQCREHWKLGLGPIPHIGRVAEHNGVILVQHLEHSDKIDAFARRGTCSVIVLNTARHSSSRWIFDIAHELGHFVMHDGIETGSKDTEEQANYFASALLLPRKSFAQEFRARPLSWTHIFNLKRRWFASASAIIRRANNLSLIDPITYRHCYQHMSIHGWLKQEPYEPDFAPPEWLNSAFELAERRNNVTAAALSERLHLNRETFTDITGRPVVTEAPIQFKPKLLRAQR